VLHLILSACLLGVGLSGSMDALDDKYAPRKIQLERSDRPV